MRGAGLRIGVVTGLAGLLGSLPLCVGVAAEGMGQAAARGSPSQSHLKRDETALKVGHPVGAGAAEPARVRAARRFLVRRGLRAGSERRKQILRFAQDDKNSVSNSRASKLTTKRAAGDASPESSTASSSAPAWTAVGPVGVNSLSYGLVTGRVSAIALDPSDATGNHVIVGTTGGGLWQSQNAAATTSSSVQFLPLTDDLGALSGVVNAGISVGAVTVQPGATGVVLAGLGDPNDALDSYYGAGLLRSTDGGQTWSLIEKTMDQEDGLGLQDYWFVGEGFAGFAWSTTNIQLVVAAVSQAYEGTLVNAGENAASYEGLYWSNDAGATWHLGRITDLDGEDVQGPFDGFVLPDGNAATSVVWNPVRQVFVAAVRYHGYYQSTDGMNWTQMPFYPDGQPGAGFTAGNCPTEPGSVGVAGCPIFRGSLAVNPQTGDTFAWSVDVFNQDQGIWQDQCGLVGFGSGANCSNPTMTFGVQLGTAALETADENGAATIENGDYNLTLAAVPSGPGAGQDTLVFAGDNDLWKCSLANSCTWRNTTNSTTCMSAQVAEYQHGFAWDAGNPLLLYVGTDGGLWRSTDQVGETGSVCAGTDAAHWQNLNASLGSLAEVDALAQSANTAATMLAGLGASGFAGIVNAPSTAGDWNEVLGGEGGAVVIDPTTAQNSWYSNNGAGVSIFHCTSGTACTAAEFGSAPVIGETQVENDGLSMTYPAEFRFDAVDHTQLLIGTCRVWRGPASGVGWTAANAISPILDGTGGTVCNGNALIRSIAVLPVTGGDEVIYVGMAGADDGGGIVAGHVFSATVSSAGVVSSWTDLTYSPVTNNGLAFNAFGQDVSGLYVDPHDATGETVYASISGFSSADEPVQKLYQSTDGGAHWTTIASNLPNAPANAVVVDTNDPNTVYVATDVGVYDTRTVGSCAAGGGAVCWSPYGTGLPLAPVTALVMTPATATSQVLTAGTYGRGIWQIPTATAGVPVTTASVSPTSLTFGNRTVGTTSAVQVVTVKATGTAPLSISSVEMTGSAAADYSETDNCAGTTVAKNASCQLNVSFMPTETGSRSGTMAINANVAGGELLVPLTGTGLATGNLTLLPTSLSFGTQQVGTTSAAQTLNLQNVGGSPVSLSGIVVTAPFVKTNDTCGGSLAAGSACAVAVDFAPTQAGSATGSFTVTDSLGTQSAALSGTGLLGATDTLSTTSLTFPATVVGQSATPMTVTITNSGGLPLTGIGTSVTSAAGNLDFTAVDNCGSQLAANSSCTITVGFAPSVATGESATLTISDALRSQSVHLSGRGVAPPKISLNPATMLFGSEEINTATAAKTLTISNTGGAPLGQPSFSISGAGSTSFAVGTSTCGASVAAGGSCTLQVIFTPLSVGGITATLTVGTTTTGVAAQSTTLSGTGLSPPMLGVSPTSVSLGTVVVGFSSNAYTVQVTNIGQVTMTEPTFAVGGITGPNGAQAGDFALSPPGDIAACTGSLAPGASCNIQVTFSPSVVGTESATLTVTGSNAIPVTTTVNLTGTGSPPIILQSNVAELDFPTAAVGTTTAPLTFTISNLGKQTANHFTLTLTGPYALAPALTTCAANLVADTSCSVGVSFSPTASGNQPGALTATVSNLSVAPVVVPLDGSGVAIGGIVSNPTQMTFGSVVVGTAATTQTLTVTNSGEATLAGLAIAATGDFSIVGNSCAATLAAGASCTTGVGFTPSANGIRSGTLTIQSDSAGVAPAVVPLTGNGIQAGSMMASPTVLSFGAETVGLTSPAQTVTVSNAGATTLAGLQFALAGDFSFTQNGCGTQLASGAMCAFSVTFSPTVPGTRIGTVTIQSSAAGFTNFVVGLTGTGLPTAQLAVTPDQLSFGSVAVGENSAPLQLTVTNGGTGTLEGLSFGTSAPFSVGSGSCGSNLSAGGSCSVPVIFEPVLGGIQNGTVAVSTTSLGVPAVKVAVMGTGLLPASLSLSPATLSFPGTGIGVSSSAQIVTVSNPGGLPLAGLSFAIVGVAAGDFDASSANCAQTLAGGGSCSVSVTFKPTVVGGREASLTASSTTKGVSNLPLSATANLIGTGLTAAALSTTPAQLTFAATQIGLVSGTQLVTVVNSGQSGITDLELTATPGFGVDPTKTTCTASLVGGGSCTAGVLFAPTAGGAYSGSLTASSILSGASPATTALSGTGALPAGVETSPLAVVQFGTTGVGQAGQPVPVTITNPGTVTSLTGLSLAVDATGMANGFGLSGSTCTATLAAGASCMVNVTFVPTAPGSLSGTLAITSGNGGNPASLQLEGIGFDFQFVITGANSATVTQGQTAYYTLALTTLGGSNGASGANFSFQCGTLPANAFCVFNPAQLGVLPTHVTGNVTLGIATGARSVASRGGVRAWNRQVLYVCGVLAIPLGWWRRRSRLKIGLLFVVSIGLVSGAGSCASSGGSGGQLHLGGGTPTGSYTATVTASANGVTHSSVVTLVVN